VKNLREFRVELLAALVVALGVLLIVDWTPIMAEVDHLIIETASHLTPGVFMGGVLITGGLAFVGWRARLRFLNSRYWRATVCPACGSAIHRVHRGLWDKAVSKVFLPSARRYRCENEQCGWSGLRKARHREVMGGERTVTGDE
jgi:hypothetical protein